MPSVSSRDCEIPYHRLSTSYTSTLPKYGANKSYTDYEPKYSSTTRSYLSSSARRSSSDSGTLSSYISVSSRLRSEKDYQSRIGGHISEYISGSTHDSNKALSDTLSERSSSGRYSLHSSGLTTTDIYNKYSPRHYLSSKSSLLPLSTRRTSTYVPSYSSSYSTTYSTSSSSYSAGDNKLSPRISPSIRKSPAIQVSSYTIGNSKSELNSNSDSTVNHSPLKDLNYRKSYDHLSTSDKDSINSSPSPHKEVVSYSQKKNDKSGGVAGLRNIGNTCFMNAVIQCLSNTKPLLEYLNSKQYLSDINITLSRMKGALIKAFSEVIQELWNKNATIVNTTSFKTQIQHYAPRFIGYNQQDAQEFLRYLLEGLHEDVNKIKSKVKSTMYNDTSSSDNQSATEAWSRYLSIENSKIVDIFVGQLKSTLRCTVCGHSSVTFDPFWDLSLPFSSRTTQLKVQQCLDSFTKEEILDGDEKPTCAKCKVRQKCTKRFTLQKCPKILVLHLKRFSPAEGFRGKLNNMVDFPLNGLDLSEYTSNKNSVCQYNLYGVANHSGSTYSGHYTAYCKHPYSGNWYEFNDTRVSSISTKNIVSREAYLLFYERVNN